MGQILIAEDELRIAAFLEKGLRRHGFQTAIAEDGQQALELALTGHFDLLLLDLGLPIKDGWTVLKELQGHTHLPVIIITAHPEDKEKAGSLAAGVIDYLTKPFRFEDLLIRVREQLQINHGSQTV